MVSSSETTIHEGLAIVTGTGWLTIFQIRLLEATCLYVCRESRRQVGRRVRVEAKTPRSLWHGGGSSTDDGASRRPDKRPAGSGPAASRSSSAHKFSWHGNSDRGTSTPASTPSATPVAPAPTTAPATTTTAATAATTAVAPLMPPPPASLTVTPSMVPSIRCVSIDWLLPATELLSPGFLWPRGVKELRFGPLFEDSIEQLVFPETLEALTFGFRFNRSLGPGRVRWPPGLKRLRLGATWNRLLVGARGTWPASLEVLEFGTGFNKPLQGGDGFGLPPGLREVNLGGVFNQPLAGVEWPPGLQELTLSEYFDQSLAFEGGGVGVSFPRGLRRICFGGRFNQEVSSTAWPQDLKVLTFGDKFNRALVSPGVDSGYTGGSGAGAGSGSSSGSGGMRPAPEAAPPVLFPPHSFALPYGLKTLLLGDDYDHPMSEGELPDSLENLVIGKSFSFVSSVRWPSSLRRLELSCRWGSGGGAGGGYRAPHWLTLPPRLEYLAVGDEFNSPLDRIAFPASLKVLVLGSSFDHPIDHVPFWDPVAEVNIDAQGLPLRPPPETLEEALAQRPPAILPDALEELRLGKAFNRDVETARLPRRLKRLVFSLDSQFDRPVAGVAWPPGLEELRFGNCFDQRLEAGGGDRVEGQGGGGFDGGGAGAGADLDPALMLPAGLRELSFGWSFSHSLQGLVLPRGLRRLCFAARYPLSHVRGLEWPPHLRSVVVGSFVMRSREEVFKWASQPPF